MNRWITLSLCSVLLTACITTKPRSGRPTESASVIPGIAVRVWGDNTCGSGALATVLNLHGDPGTEAELDSRLPKGAHGGVVSIDLLLETRRRGFEAALIRGDSKKIRFELSAGRPVILMLKILDAPGKRQDLFHYIIVDGYDPGRELFRTQFGDGGVRWTSLDRIDQAWAGGGNAVLAITPRNSDARLSDRIAEAVALEERGQTAQAIGEYKRILEQDPSSVRVWTNLGNALRDSSQPKEAEDAYRRAVAIDPDAVDALNNLAWQLLVEERELEEAENFARKALRNSLMDRDLYLDTLGRILLARGKCEESEEVLARAISETPVAREESRAGLYAALGFAQQRCSRLSNARQSFEKALMLNPDPKLRSEIEAALARSIPPGL